MDSPLKERLTGALIVVAVLVIVVPEMLSGPGKPSAASGGGADAGPPLRTYSLDLGTSPDARKQDQSALTPQSAEPATPPPPAPAVEPAPVAPAEAAPEIRPAAGAADAPAIVNAVPVPAPAATAPPAAAADVKPAAESAANAKGQWWTQLGSFSARDNAERLARELRGKGYSINVAKIRVGARDLYRVRAGPVASRDAAVALQSRLAAAGHKSSLVAP